MLGIVILNYRGAEKVIQLLKDLQACKKPETPVRAYVVDNASGDDSLRVLAAVNAEWSAVRLVISERNDGYGPGNNIGIARALEDGCDLLIVLNPDVRIRDTGFLQRCVDAAATLPPTAAIISPRIVGEGGEADADIGLLNSFTGRFEHRLKDSGVLAPRQYPLGCGLLIRGDYARRVAGRVFRENLFLYAEEFFLKLDVERLGYSCWSSPSICITHENMASTETIPVSMGFRRRLSDRNLLWYAKERHGILYEVWLSLWVILRGLVRWGIHRDFQELRVATAAVSEAWAGSQTDGVVTR